MSQLAKVWRGTGFNENVRLFQYLYSDGSTHYTFYPRVGSPANPNEEEAAMVIKRFNLKEVEVTEC